MKTMEFKTMEDKIGEDNAIEDKTKWRIEQNVDKTK